MIDIVYANAYKEVIEVLKHVSKEDYDKIPQDKINLFKKCIRCRKPCLYHIPNPCIFPINATMHICKLRIAGIPTTKYQCFVL